jgi:hypothetical protein
MLRTWDPKSRIPEPSRVLELSEQNLENLKVLKGSWGSLKIKGPSQVQVAQAYNPSYWEGREQEDLSPKPAQGK